VLVVDDNQDGADSLKELLELEGHSVEVAYDGRAGIEKARAIRPEIIICDIGLPGLNGFEVARQIRADLGSSPTLVALTGYAQADDQCRAFDAGFDHHLSKPMDLQKIRALLGRHRNGAHDTDAGA
jgi:CheY-like chemotaxis protein